MRKGYSMFLFDGHLSAAAGTIYQKLWEAVQNQELDPRVLLRDTATQAKYFVQSSLDDTQLMEVMLRLFNRHNWQLAETILDVEQGRLVVIFELELKTGAQNYNRAFIARDVFNFCAGINNLGFRNAPLPVSLHTPSSLYLRGLLGQSRNTEGMEFEGEPFNGPILASGGAELAFPKSIKQGFLGDVLEAQSADLRLACLGDHFASITRLPVLDSYVGSGKKVTLFERILRAFEVATKGSDGEFIPLADFGLSARTELLNESRRTMLRAMMDCNSILPFAPSDGVTMEDWQRLNRILGQTGYCFVTFAGCYVVIPKPRYSIPRLLRSTHRDIVVDFDLRNHPVVLWSRSSYLPLDQIGEGLVGAGNKSSFGHIRMAGLRVIRMKDGKIAVSGEGSGPFYRALNGSYPFVIGPNTDMGHDFFKSCSFLAERKQVPVDPEATITAPRA